MGNSNILFKQQGHIAYITLNRPEKGNVLTAEMGQELAELSTQINGDEAIWVVVIKAKGPTFCSGSEIPADSSLKISPASALAAINRPTLAVINGDAIGSGLELALACDLRLAADSARFALPQIKQGRIPDDGGTQRLSRLVGKGKAMEMILTGKTIDSKEALEIGLINKTLKAAELDAEAETLAATLATKAPQATRYCKEAVMKGLDLTLEQGLRLEADVYFLLHTTADRSEGVKSFLEKRKPEYEGR
jgi:enoyl-CoA hydratase/carnithine racemase